MRYDAQKMADLVSRRSDLQASLTAISTRMHDRTNTDKTFTDKMTAAHERDAIDHGVATRDLQIVNAEIDRMNDVRPMSKERSQSPLQRFLRGGIKLLGETDTAQFRPTQEEMASFGVQLDAGGEVFMIPASIDGQRAAMGGDPQMASPLTDTAAGRGIVPSTTTPPVDTLDFVGSALDAFSRFNSANGNPMRVPQFDTAGQKGRILGGQGQAAQNRDLPEPTNAMFEARTGTSDEVDLAMEAIADTAFDLVGYGIRQANRRLVKIWNQVMTLNDHTGTPHGVIGTAKAGVDSGTDGSFDWEDMVDLRYSINRAYRDPMGEGVGAGFRLEGQGMIGYMVSDGAEKIMVKLKDTENRPLYLPSLAAGVPSTFNGWPVIVNGDMAEPAPDSLSVAFGNFASFGCRVVGGTMVYRFFDSGTARNYETRIIAFNRMDGKVRLPLPSAGGVGVASKNPAVALMKLGD